MFLTSFFPAFLSSSFLPSFSRPFFIHLFLHPPFVSDHSFVHSFNESTFHPPLLPTIHSCILSSSTSILASMNRIHILPTDPSSLTGSLHYFTCLSTCTQAHVYGYINASLLPRTRTQMVVLVSIHVFGLCVGPLPHLSSVLLLVTRNPAE